MVKVGVYSPSCLHGHIWAANCTYSLRHCTHHPKATSLYEFTSFATPYYFVVAVGVSLSGRGEAWVRIIDQGAFVVRVISTAITTALEMVAGGLSATWLSDRHSLVTIASLSTSNPLCTGSNVSLIRRRLIGCLSSIGSWWHVIEAFLAIFAILMEKGASWTCW